MDTLYMILNFVAENETAFIALGAATGGSAPFVIKLIKTMGAVNELIEHKQKDKALSAKVQKIVDKRIDKLSRKNGVS